MTAAYRIDSSNKGPRPFTLTNIRRWSWGEWGAILAVAGFYMILKMIGAPSGIEKQQLRAQFHIPDNVALTKVEVNRSKTKLFPADIEGVVHFAEPQFRTYLARLDDPKVWQPVPLLHGGTKFDGSYAPDALVWRDIQGTRGGRHVSFGNLSAQQAQNARDGRELCFVLREDRSGVGSSAFRGEACGTHGAGSSKAAYVKGLLDFDTRTLHMLIRQTRQ